MSKLKMLKALGLGGTAAVTVGAGSIVVADGVTHAKNPGQGIIGGWAEWLNRALGESTQRANYFVSETGFYNLVRMLGSILMNLTDGAWGKGLIDWAKESEKNMGTHGKKADGDTEGPSGNLKKASLGLVGVAGAGGLYAAHKTGMLGKMGFFQKAAAASAAAATVTKPSLWKAAASAVMGKTILGKAARIAAVGGAAYVASDTVKGTINTVASEIKSATTDLVKGNWSWEDAQYKGEIAGQGLLKGAIEVPALAGHLVDAFSSVANVFRSKENQIKFDASTYVRDGLKGIFGLQSVEQIAHKYKREPSTLDRGIDLASQFTGAAVAGGATAKALQGVGLIPSLIAKHIPTFNAGN